MEKSIFLSTTSEKTLQMIRDCRDLNLAFSIMRQVENIRSSLQLFVLSSFLSSSSMPSARGNFLGSEPEFPVSGGALPAKDSKLEAICRAGGGGGACKSKVETHEHDLRSDGQQNRTARSPVAEASSSRPP